MNATSTPENGQHQQQAEAIGESPVTARPDLDQPIDYLPVRYVGRVAEAVANRIRERGVVLTVDELATGEGR